MNTSHLPTSIPAYLDQLRRALAGADPALVQDALYDAEEYLRSELAEQPGRSEAEVIASVASSYGAPDEVAEIYRDTEVKVQTALQPPAPRPLLPPAPTPRSRPSSAPRSRRTSRRCRRSMSVSSATCRRRVSTSSRTTAPWSRMSASPRRSRTEVLPPPPLTESATG